MEAFAQVPALYIADGHHRAASAARARAELRQRGRRRATPSTFIAVAFPDNQMQILPYNRTVKDLAGRTPAAVPRRAARAVPRHRRAARSRAARARCRCSSTASGTRSICRRRRRADDSRASALDVALLQHHVLEQLLKIGDVRTDKRIDFVGGARGTAALERAVDSGKAAVAFSMFPVTVADLMAISDAGGIMPPKSTWFEPKLRDGLLIHEI